MRRQLRTADITASFQGASTGYGVLSPGGYSLVAVLVVEVVATAVFLFVILGVTSSRAAVGFAPWPSASRSPLLALVAIPVSNASFNPARSIATAIYGGPDALGQVWLSILAPIVGADHRRRLLQVHLRRHQEEDVAARARREGRMLRHPPLVRRLAVGSRETAAPTRR